MSNRTATEITKGYNLISGIVESASLIDMLQRAEEAPEYALACAELLQVVETHHARGEA